MLRSVSEGELADGLFGAAVAVELSRSWTLGAQLGFDAGSDWLDLCSL